MEQFGNPDNFLEINYCHAGTLQHGISIVDSAGITSTIKVNVVGSPDGNATKELVAYLTKKGLKITKLINLVIG